MFLSLTYPKKVSDNNPTQECDKWGPKEFSWMNKNLHIYTYKYYINLQKSTNISAIFSSLQRRDDIILAVCCTYNL